MEEIVQQHQLAKARIHGWGGWYSLQYKDAEEEAAFVASDFKSSRDATMLLNAFVIACSWPVADAMVAGKPTHQYLNNLICGCFSLQLLSRGLLDRLADQRLAAEFFGWVTYATTFVEWLCVLHVDRSTGWTVYDDDSASMLVLTILIIFFQGLTVCWANGYRAVLCGMQGLSYIAVVTLVVCQHVPSRPKLLLRESEFIGIFCLIDVGVHTLVISQIYSRRICVAQLAGLAEQLAQQRDRLAFALAFAEKRTDSASDPAGSAPESCHSHTGPAPSRGVQPRLRSSGGSSRGNSARQRGGNVSDGVSVGGGGSVIGGGGGGGSGASSYGTNPEICGFVQDVVAEERDDDVTMAVYRNHRRLRDVARPNSLSPPGLRTCARDLDTAAVVRKGRTATGTRRSDGQHGHAVRRQRKL